MEREMPIEKLRGRLPNVELEGFRKTPLLELPLSDFTGDRARRWRQIKPLAQEIIGTHRSMGVAHPKALDLALGSGQDSLSFYLEGCDVVSNEVDPAGIDRARELMRKVKLPLDLRQSAWQDMGESSEYKPEEFDIVFSLGNSFPNYLLTEGDRVKALQSFWRVLKPGGTLLFDTRNFDYMLENSGEILQDPEKNFDYRYRSTYLGEDVKGFPTEITPERIHFIWKHYKNHAWSELDLWPATQANVRELIAKGIEKNTVTEVLYDFGKEKPDHYDFVEYVLHKKVDGR